jgi:hypothetical protein
MRRRLALIPFVLLLTQCDKAGSEPAASACHKKQHATCTVYSGYDAATVESMCSDGLVISTCSKENLAGVC